MIGIDLWVLRESCRQLQAWQELHPGTPVNMSVNLSGAFALAVVPIVRQWFAVARYESFHQQDADRDLSLYIGGVAWRPRPALVLKAEWSRATDNDADLPDGWRASFAVLF